MQGLAVTRSIITAMGGQISIDPSYTNGTRVVIHLSLPCTINTETVDFVQSVGQTIKQSALLMQENMVATMEENEGNGLMQRRISAMESEKSNEEKEKKKVDDEEREEVAEEGQRVRKVLIVDDNPMNRMILKKTILREFKNAVVEQGVDGAHAVNLAKQAIDEPFDIVFIDIWMPNMNGIEATKKLREIDVYKKTPIYANTAHAATNELPQRLFNGVITKPYQIQDIIEKVMIC